MSQDVLIGYFFDNKDLQSIADRQFEFLLLASGLRTEYKGKTPTHAHLELPPIFTGHFDRRLQILKETLTAQGLTEDQIQTWIEFENAFRNVIIDDSKNLPKPKN